MKTALVMPLAEARGGAEEMLLRLLRANRQGPGVDYRLAFLQDGPMTRETAALGYPIRVFPAGHLRQAHCWAATVLRLRRWFQEERLDGVMSWMTKAHLYAGPAARGAGLPATWWQHGIASRHWMDRLATRIPARAVFCCSRHAAQAQERLKPRSCVRVVYPAVDTERFDSTRLPPPAEARARLRLPADRPIFGTVCRLQSQKGLHILLDAARRMVSGGMEAHFLIVGGEHPLEPAYAAALQRQTEQAGLAACARFTGYQANIPLWMQAMDTVVLASTGQEGFGMVLIEAMALGKAVIGPRAGGPMEIIREGVNGLLAEPGDAGALADAMTRSLTLPAAVREAARDRAAQFSAAHLAAAMARELQEFYLERV